MEKKYLTLNCVNQKLIPKIISGYESIEDVIDLSNSKNYKKNDNDIIYLFPGTLIPRFKLRDKFKLTTKIENATVAFIPSNLKAFNRVDYCTYKADTILNAFDRIYGQENKKHKFVESLLENYECLVDYDSKYSNVMLDSGDIIGFWQIAGYYDLKSIYTLDDSIKETISKATCPIYTENELIPFMNENSYVIDNEKYKELRAMFQSADDDTIIMGMELLANTDYDKSLVYIILLLKEFGGKFYRKKQCDHINFKALLNYLNLAKLKLKRCDGYHDSWRVAECIVLDDVVRILKEHNKFNKDSVSSVTPLFIYSTPNEENKKYFLTNALNINIKNF